LTVDLVAFDARFQVTIDSEQSLLRPLARVVRDTEHGAIVAAVEQAAHSVADEMVKHG